MGVSSGGVVGKGTVQGSPHSSVRSAKADDVLTIRNTFQTDW